jgi:hypothetical protein
VKYTANIVPPRLTLAYSSHLVGRNLWRTIGDAAFSSGFIYLCELEYKGQSPATLLQVLIIESTIALMQCSLVVKMHRNGSKVAKHCK